ncbi:putative imidazolonepropionase [Trypanosoma cruzi]|uniref:Probable imidazolonepropionase n=1 Tax=Trypanosoma cruzi (strain CL Brener) TaxID=353153 RepID=Q4CVT7_TRYCC|nr:imidazolonepropionase, putative [Trypanosoma cruzi]XP_821047.1 imidazolonepropionase, putative [Trypanosoma cruzi]EAN84390.1 imidazolonepropionase, putative [Trypanosoma cruzi]EAN99196.1 imidazolonepropionase, putative [Trypanosoma cruzi]RNC46843.1 putative imidazolonepropionase [Trypanosoma cruzi]|eukprot:XP_806241.1 imidazolonepropionase [Trypanosoma cruzi strain CL Brener]
MLRGMLLFHNAEQVVQVVCGGERYVAGREQSNRIAVIPHGSLLVDTTTGNIAAVGTNDEVQAFVTANKCNVTDTVPCEGKVLLPGFVDAHTHPVWDGDRAHEFTMKLNGASYMDVQRAGGGIGFTTRCTRAASEAELKALLRRRLQRMLSFGTTTVEGKSGYGLERDTELKMLRVLKQANDEGPLTIVSTFCGAHAVPEGKTAEEAVRDVVEVQLPAVMQERAEGRNDVQNIDVFCELGVFDHDQSRRVLEAGRKSGLIINFHGDELSYVASGELAGELEAQAVSHLEHVSDEGIACMSKRPTFAVLLPMTAYVLRIAPPPARKLIDGHVPVALGSDFCPNAHSLSMPHTMNVSCVLMHMTVEEALVAATINAAGSLNMSDRCGSLEVGKWADVVLLHAPRWEHVVYQMVDPPIEAVYKKGRLVYSKELP